MDNCINIKNILTTSEDDECCNVWTFSGKSKGDWLHEDKGRCEISGIVARLTDF